MRSNLPLPRRAAVAVLLVLAAPSGLAAATGPAIRPVIGLADGAVVACGIEAELGTRDEAAIVRLVLRRTEAGPRIRLSLADPRAVASRVELVVGDLRTAGFGVEPVEAGESFAASAPAGGDLAALFQRLFLSGGTLRVERGGDVAEHALPGPFASGVRSSFLNCSGDLYRQER